MELKWKLRFLTLTNRSLKRLSNYEEIGSRKATRKRMEEIDRFKTKINGIKKLTIETIQHDSSKIIIWILKEE